MIKNELPYSKEDYYVGAQGNPELNIDITANGDYDVRKYATAKVNVSGGGGDFNNAVVRIVSNASRTFTGNFVDLVDQETGELSGAIVDDGVYYIWGDDYIDVPVPALGEKDVDVMIVEGHYVFLFFDRTLTNGITVEGSADKYYYELEGRDCVRIWGDCVVTLPVIQTQPEA